MTKPKRPWVAVDCVVWYGNGIVLVRRKNPPFKGYWALPGGFVEYGETVEEAVVREVLEETGLKVNLVGLVGVYSKPDRDPRWHIISIAYFAKAVGGMLKASSDAAEAKVFNVRNLPRKLAFDHDIIIRDALKKYGSLIGYT